MIRTTAQDKPDGFAIAMMMAFKLVKIGLQIAWRLATTIGYLFIWMWTVSVSDKLMIAWLVAMVAILAVPMTRRFGIGVWDYRRYRAVRRHRKLLLDGNMMLRQFGLVSENDETIYDAAFEDKNEEAVFVLGKPIFGVSPARIVETCSAYRSQFDALRTVSKQLGGGAMEVRFIRVDELDKTRTIEHPTTLDVETMSLPVGVDDSGDEFTFSFKNNSGLLLGGLAGGGKTAAASTFLAPLTLASTAVDMSIVDCKGGDDWTAYAPAVDRFMAVSTDFTGVLDLLNDAVAEMNERIATNLSKLGVSNFWEASAQERNAAGLKFKVIVIDECQSLFDTTGVTDKDEKARMAEITRRCIDLIKRGRSAGVFLILITQKPTADSIPTAIRDNVQIRMALRVSTAETEKAIFGSFPDDLDVPRAVDIPAHRRGGAVVESEDGTRKAIRFYYFPEKDLRRFIATSVEQRNGRQKEEAHAAA